MRTILASGLMLAALTQLAPLADAADSTYWGAAAVSCTPHDDASRNDRYFVTGPTVTFEGSSLTSFIFYCHVGANAGGQLPNALALSYRDDNGWTDPDDYVKATFYRLTFGTSTITSIASVSSASFAGSTSAQEHWTGFAHAIDFDNYAYYVRADLKRDDVADALSFLSTRLMSVIE